MVLGSYKWSVILFSLEESGNLMFSGMMEGNLT